MLAAEKINKHHALKILVRLWPIMSPFRLWFVLGIVLVLFSTALEVTLPVIVGKAVDIVTLPSGQRHLLFSMATLYFVCILSRVFLDSARALVIQITGQRVMHKLRGTVFLKIQNLPVAFFDKNPTGRLLTRVINDIKALSELFTAAMTVLLLDCLIITGTIVAMFYLHPGLAFWVLLTFPAVFLTIYVFGEKLAVLYRDVRLRLAEMNAFLGENIAGMLTIQRLNAETERMEKFTRIIHRYNEQQMKTVKTFSLVQPITNILNGTAMGTLLIYGGYLVIHEKISLGVLVVFLGYIRNLFQPVRDLVEKYNIFLSALVSAERVVTILDEPDEYDKTSTLTRLSAGFSFDIRFTNVSFTYPSRHTKAIDSVSFHAPEGKSLAIVGATGSGKSTIIRLLLRFYEPTEGEIQIGGISIKNWDKKLLRTTVGVVHQDIYLFQGMLRENLTLNHTSYSDEFLVYQCQRTHLWENIASRGGLDMEIQEGGSNLSVGEKQLLSLARILILNPKVLILDEATSSIDPRLERLLMEGIAEVLKNRTAIIIAHRLSTIKNCDHLVVMENGQLVQEGSYDALSKRPGVFQTFQTIFQAI